MPQPAHQLKPEKKLMRNLRKVALLVVIAVGMGNWAASTAATVTSSVSAQDIAQLIVTMESASYVQGSVIRLSIGIKNISSAGIGVPLHAPWIITALTVRDSSGNVVKPRGNPASEGPGRMVNIIVAPGETFTLRRDFRERAKQQFYPLQNWGFYDLPPGAYSITAVENEGIYFPFSETPGDYRTSAIVGPNRSEAASNVASFTVTK